VDFKIKFKMKKALLVVVLGLFLGACNLNYSNTSIKVKETAERYELTAKYPKTKAVFVQHCLKSTLKEDSIQLDEGVQAGKEMVLGNGVKFYLRSNPGKLEAEMIKSKNSALGYRYFDSMVKQIEATLK
jgi:hypothetical protein